MFSKTTRTAVIATVAILALAAFCAAPASEGDASQSFTITDSTGTGYAYSAPSERIIVTGYAATLTLIDAGMASKIYATDQYGQVAFDDECIGLGDTKVFRTSYSDVSGLKSSIIGAVDDGFSKDGDTVILTAFTTPYAGKDMKGGLRAELMDIGFSKVLFYGSIYEYSGIVSIVNDLERISGSTAGLTASMEAAYEKVTSAVSGLEKKDAIFLRYSGSNGWGIGVSGSIGGTLIGVAGGNDLGSEAGSTSTLYNTSKIVEILSDHPGAIIFLDSPYFDSYDGTFQKFVDDVLGGDQADFGLVKMLKTWNNYDPESAEGLIEIAHVLHPDAVDGTVEALYADSGDDDSDGTTAIAIAVIIVIIIAIAGFLVLRSRKSA